MKKDRKVMSRAALGKTRNGSNPMITGSSPTTVGAVDLEFVEAPSGTVVSAVWDDLAQKLTVTFVADDTPAGEIVDATFMSAKALGEFIAQEIDKTKAETFVDGDEYVYTPN